MMGLEHCWLKLRVVYTIIFGWAEGAATLSGQSLSLAYEAEKNMYISWECYPVLFVVQALCSIFS